MTSTELLSVALPPGLGKKPEAGEYCMVRGAGDIVIVKVLRLYKRTAIVEWRGLVFRGCPIEDLIPLRPFPHPMFPWFPIQELEEAPK